MKSISFLSQVTNFKSDFNNHLKSVSIQRGSRVLTPELPIVAFVCPSILPYDFCLM